MAQTASAYFVALMRRVGEEYLDAMDSGTTLIPSPVPPPSAKALVRRASFHEAGHGIMNWQTPAAAFIRSMRLSEDCDDTGVITAWNTHLPRHVLLWDLLTHGKRAEALKVYRWYTPVLHLDTHVKLVQYIKLAVKECGLGADTVRMPRLPLTGAERERIVALIRKTIATRPGKR